MKLSKKLQESGKRLWRKAGNILRLNGKSAEGERSGTVIAWDGKALGVLRQAYRVAVDPRFRQSDEGKRVMKKYRVSPGGDSWETFFTDIRNYNGDKYEGVGFVADYARYLIRFLVHRVPTLPDRYALPTQWYKSSSLRMWELERPERTDV